MAGSKTRSSTNKHTRLMEADSASIGLYHAEVQKALVTEHAQLQEMQAIKEDLRATRDLVLDLPSRLRHKVFVPFGPHAFFPGQLQHTNELTVHLGANHFATVTAKHAAGVLKRREASIDRALFACQQQVDAHEARLQLASKEVLGLGMGAEEHEIRESYEESEALLASARTASTRDKQEHGASHPAIYDQQGHGTVPRTEQEPSPGQPVPAEGEESQVGKWEDGSGARVRELRQQLKQQQQEREQREKGGDVAQASGSEGDEYAQLFARMEELEAAEEAAQLRAVEEDGEEEEEEDPVETVCREDGEKARGYLPHNRLGAKVLAAEEDREPDSDDEDDEFTGAGGSYQTEGRGIPAGTAADDNSAAQATSGLPAAPVLGKPAPAAFRASNQEPLKGAPQKSALKKGFLLSSTPSTPPNTQHQQHQQQQQPAVSAAVAASRSKEMAFSRERAFTGQVLERPGLQAPLLQPQELQGQQRQVLGTTEGVDSSSATTAGLHEQDGGRVGAVTEVKERVVKESEGEGKGQGMGAEGMAASASRRPSKFKQKMMGLG